MNQAFLKELSKQYVSGLIDDVEFLTQVQVPFDIQQRLIALSEMPQAVHLKLSIEDIWPQAKPALKKVAASEVVTPQMAKRRYWTKLEQFADGLVIDNESQLRITEYDADEDGGDEAKGNCYSFVFSDATMCGHLYRALKPHSGIGESGVAFNGAYGLVIGGLLLKRHLLEVTPDLLHKAEAKKKDKAPDSVVRMRYMEKLVRAVMPIHSAQEAQVIIDSLTVVRKTEGDVISYVFCTDRLAFAERLTAAFRSTTTTLNVKAPDHYEITVWYDWLADNRLVPPTAALSAEQ